VKKKKKKTLIPRIRACKGLVRHSWVDKEGVGRGRACHKAGRVQLKLRERAKREALKKKRGLEDHIGGKKKKEKDRSTLASEKRVCREVRLKGK